ncbi:arylsulfatase [Bryocella elongata]|uniref:Arylsulfatase n=1 Tax=Bryocella elongata TaxID=863522 RepID=A0A1H5XWH1_9BACT|nr:arylsulfatase [Bryocella elongata]SEG16114.1 arylsulfatase [Bryocella elongata]
MTNRRDFLRMGAGMAAAGAATGVEAATGEPAARTNAPRPNIILILADDMGFSDIGCFGSEIATPHLDKLAQRGMRLTEYYNNPRCCPSRASIMTGLYSHQAGMGNMVVDHNRYPFPAYAGILSAQTITIPEALKTAGYNTAMVGKWHLAPETEESKPQWPLQRGFDRFSGMISGASVYYESPHLFDGNTTLPPPPKDKYLTDIWAEKAAGYVTELAAEGKMPFFLYAAFNAPHWPIQAPEEDVKKYADRYREGWDKLREERHARQIAEGIVDPKWPLSPRDPRVPAWEKAEDKEWEIRRMAVYAAMIDKLDQGIGRIVDAVEKAGVMENTLIVFMSDNGGNAEELGRGQRTLPVTDSPEGPLHGFDPKGSIPCENGMTCAGNIPGVMPGGEETFQSIGIPWGNCANTPFRLYKHYAQEGGISSPFVACWPKVIKPMGRPMAAVGHETDLMPTFLEAAGVTYPTHVAAGPIPAFVGQSLMPLFEGKKRTRQPIFWEHEGNRAVRDGQWKLVSRFPDAWELYDMEADRTELHDLAAAQPARTKAMAAMWDEWAKLVGAQPWPMPQTPPGERTGEMGTPPYLRRYKA